MTRILLSFFLIFTALPLHAQNYPIHETTYVNDYAQLLDETAHRDLTRMLEALREETSVEVTVLTLHTRRGFDASSSLEAFATGLFNHWGIGNAERNDGILILVISEDREMRIELGQGYDQAYNRYAQSIINTTFLPPFREGDYQTGILQGTQATLTEIARRHHAGEAALESTGNGNSGDNTGNWVSGALIAVFAGVFGLIAFGRRITDRFRRCPQCGNRGLSTNRKTLQSATRTRQGQGLRTITCPHCGHHDSSYYTIARRSSSRSSSGGSFGGGSSSGGGASGRW
jgi:uncharacterized protein